MKHCTMAKQSWRLALMEYLATPLDCNTPSPSESNGHRFNSLLPNISHSKHSDKPVDRHGAQLQCNKRGHALPELPVGSKVGYRNHVTNEFDVGIISARDARSYIVYMENGVHVSQNHIDLKQTDVPFEPKTKTQPFVSSNANHKHAPTTPVPSSTNVKHNSKAKLTQKRVEVRKSSLTNSMYTTCSGHISKARHKVHYSNVTSTFQSLY